MTAASPNDEITRYLRNLEQGEQGAMDELLPRVYDDLRALARGLFEARRKDITLQPTALVHECYMRLVKKDEPDWEDRRHFFNVAALAMRQLLASHARQHFAAKRGGVHERVVLDPETNLGKETDGVDIVALDDALTRLAGVNQRQARVVELRFLAGLSVEETADVLAVSERTVYVDWQMARAWLSRELA